ncbi:unnamed protein product [Porites lobata]|uniref:Uncharacterized protein n=1 Tax=Porites lobata TaxID=104759 RepID=A0ABN8NUE1_9CNID|nr:unnamed protein product [Porites lobata]
MSKKSVAEELTLVTTHWNSSNGLRHGCLARFVNSANYASLCAMENWLGCERLLYSIRMDSGRSEGKRKTKKYLEKEEELGGSQSGCTRQKVLVRQQHGGLMRQLAR